MSARKSLSPGSSLSGIQEMYYLDDDDQHLNRAKRTSLAQIAIPSFSAFRERASSIPIASPVRRKPLPKNASPRAISDSHGSLPIPYDASAAVRQNPSSYIESPQLQQSTVLSNVVTPPLTAHTRTQDSRKAEHSYEQAISYPHNRAVSIDTRLAETDVKSKRFSTLPAVTRPCSIPVPLRYGDKDDGTFHHQHAVDPSISSIATASNRTSTHSSHRRASSSIMSSESPVQPPSMTVRLEGTDGIQRSFTDESFDSSRSISPTKRSSKASGTKFSSFFGWKSSPQLGDGQSPTTTFSDHSSSPMPSPSLHKAELFDVRQSGMGLSPPAIDIQRANQPQAQYFDVPGTPLLSGSVTINLHIEELERELRQISAELAGSIRREMDLEDEVERYRADLSSMTQDHPQDLNRRGSDYFSDSGTSSLRFPLGDSDAKIDELERMRRKAEQEKAQMQVEYAQKLAQELNHRKTLEAQLHTFEEELQGRRQTQPEEPVADERVRELETYLDDTRRRLSQERQAKDNFEDLFAALREESAKYRNDRDNLRDEVLPQLRARIEGLEAEAVEMKSAQYEHTRMQQEIQALKSENEALREAKNNQSAFNTIAEDDTVSAKAWPRAGLSRSNSFARNSPAHGPVKRGSSLTRSGSVKERGSENRHRSDSSSNERVKDVEEQRDALHKALKNLLRRFENQKREHAKAMRRLIADHEHAKTISPPRVGYSREVNYVREEAGVLRRRADDALEQKWQAENNISGVKMALDRAEQETRSLRQYLAGRQSGLIRSLPRSSSVNSGLGISLSGEHSEAGASSVDEAERHAMIKVLRQSIQVAESERDAALKEAEAYRERARSLQNAEDAASDEEQEVARELLAAAGRMEELANMVATTIESNIGLRQRLTDAVTKGEQQQHESTARITNMQSRLKEMEENVMQAQQQSEAALGSHEEVAKKLDECNSPQLSRFNGFSPLQRHSPVVKSPIISQGLFAKSPKTKQNNTNQAESLFEATKTALLERKVRELEAALAEADSEMKEVVERINNSQYEIAELQGERDEAQRLMRSLQKDISDERERTLQLMSPV